MKSAFITTMFLISIILAVLLVGTATSWFGLVVSRPMQQYQKETERQVYQNSVARQQGANNGISQDCANMQSNTGPQQLAFARFVISDAAAYSGDRGLSADSLACLQSARTLINNSNQ